MASLVSGLFTGAKISSKTNILADVSGNNLNAQTYRRIMRSSLLLADEEDNTNYIINVSGINEHIFLNSAKNDIYPKINSISGALYNSISGLNNLIHKNQTNLEENTNLISGIQNIYSNGISELNNKIDNLDNNISGLNLYIKNLSGTINSKFNNLKNDIYGSLSEINIKLNRHDYELNKIYSYISGININIKDNENYINILSGLINGLSDDDTKYDEKFESINNKLDNMDDRISFLLSKFKYNITYDLEFCKVKINNIYNPTELLADTYILEIIPDTGYEYSGNLISSLIINGDANISCHCTPKKFNIIIYETALEHCNISSPIQENIYMGETLSIHITPETNYTLDTIISINNASSTVSGNNITIKPNGNGDITINKISAYLPSCCLFVDSSYIDSDIFGVGNSLIISGGKQSPLNPSSTYQMRQVPYKNEQLILYMVINKQYINIQNKTIIYNNEEYILSDAVLGGEYTIQEITEYNENYYKCLICDGDDIIESNKMYYTDIILKIIKK